jgi:hypothetical protein
MEAARPLEEEIFFYVSHLNTEQKKAVLSVVKNMADTEDQWWESIEEEAAPSIQKAMQQVKKGKLTPHDEVMKKFRS